MGTYFGEHLLPIKEITGFATKQEAEEYLHALGERNGKVYSYCEVIEVSNDFSLGK